MSMQTVNGKPANLDGKARVLAAPRGVILYRPEHRQLRQGSIMTENTSAKWTQRFDQPVRCRGGHLFTTIWVPGGSLKAIRLGNRRFQRCPIGHHWTTVVRLDRTSATTADLEQAAAVHDIRIP
jgi:hypothetical protein